MTDSLFFFFFNEPAPTEIYTRPLVGSVRCVKETEVVEPADGNQPTVEHHEPRQVIALAAQAVDSPRPVSYTHLRAHETVLDLVCRLLLEKKKITIKKKNTFLAHSTKQTTHHLHRTAHSTQIHNQAAQL